MSLGIGVIGAGVMGADHVRTIAGHIARAHVAAVCDQDAARAEAAAGPAKARTETDPFALIAATDVDAVVVASPDETHADYARACIDAGKPVLVEKPLAPTVADCLPVLEAEQAAGRRLVQVGFMRRFDPAYEALKAGLAEGGLGRLLMAHCIHRNQKAPSFFHGLMAITNGTVHEFDILRWLLGNEIVSIQALSSAAAHPNGAHDPILLLLHTDAGQVIDVEFYANSGYGYDIRTELICENGTLTMQPPHLSELRQAGVPAFGFAQDWRPRFADAYRRQMQAFVNAIGDGHPVGASAWDGLVATAIAEAGCASLEAGAPAKVDLPERPAFYA